MKAWELIERSWVPRCPDLRKNEHCAVTAISFIYPRDNEPFEKVLAEIKTGSIVEWNDAPGRTKEDVVNLLKKLNL